MPEVSKKTKIKHCVRLNIRLQNKKHALNDYREQSKKFNRKAQELRHEVEQLEREARNDSVATVVDVIASNPFKKAKSIFKGAGVINDTMTVRNKTQKWSKAVEDQERYDNLITRTRDEIVQIEQEISSSGCGRTGL